jgi:hypothetical protein
LYGLGGHLKTGVLGFKGCGSVSGSGSELQAGSWRSELAVSCRASITFDLDRSSFGLYKVLGSAKWY